MANNNFQIKLLASLDADLSYKKILSDITSIETKLKNDNIKINLDVQTAQAESKVKQTVQNIEKTLNGSNVKNLIKDFANEWFLPKKFQDDIHNMFKLMDTDVNKFASEVKRLFEDIGNQTVKTYGKSSKESIDEMGKIYNYMKGQKISYSKDLNEVFDFKQTLKGVSTFPKTGGIALDKLQQEMYGQKIINSEQAKMGLADFANEIKKSIIEFRNLKKYGEEVPREIKENIKNDAMVAFDQLITKLESVRKEQKAIEEQAKATGSALKNSTGNTSGKGNSNTSVVKKTLNQDNSNSTLLSRENIFFQEEDEPSKKIIREKDNLTKELITTTKILNGETNEYDEIIRREKIDHEKNAKEIEKERKEKEKLVELSSKVDSSLNKQKTNEIEDDIALANKIADEKQKRQDTLHASALKEYEEYKRIQQNKIKVEQDYENFWLKSLKERAIKEEQINDKMASAFAESQRKIRQEREKTAEADAKISNKLQEDNWNNMLNQAYAENDQFNRTKRKDFNLGDVVSVNPETINSHKKLNDYIQSEYGKSAQVVKDFTKSMDSHNQVISQAKFRVKETTEDGTKKWRNYSVSLNEATGKVHVMDRGLTDVLNRQMSFANKIQTAISGISTWAIATTLFYGGLRQLQDGVKYIYDLENSLNEIRIVTGKSAEEVRQYAKVYNQTAKEMGVTTAEVAKTTVDLYRQGLSKSQAEERMQSIIQYAKVSNITLEESNKIITATANATGESAQKITDIFSYLGRFCSVA